MVPSARRKARASSMMWVGLVVVVVVEVVARLCDAATRSPTQSCAKWMDDGSIRSRGWAGGGGGAAAAAFSSVDVEAAAAEVAAAVDMVAVAATRHDSPTKLRIDPERHFEEDGVLYHVLAFVPSNRRTKTRACPWGSASLGSRSHTIDGLRKATCGGRSTSGGSGALGGCWENLGRRSERGGLVVVVVAGGVGGSAADSVVVGA